MRRIMEAFRTPLPHEGKLLAAWLVACAMWRWAT